MKTKKQSWFSTEWCLTHDGFMPVSDLKRYACNNCKKNGCVMDVFETKKGKMCGNCVMKMPKQEEWLELQHGFEALKAKTRIAKIAIVFTEVFLLQAIVLLFVEGRLKTGIIGTSIAVYLIMIGIIIWTIAGITWIAMQSNLHGLEETTPVSRNKKKVIA